MGVLPDWCDPLPGTEAMRLVDRWAMEEQHIPSLDLMERAGTGVARAVELLAPDGTVAVVCGKGNNGGDGLVAARILRQAGWDVTILLAARPEELRGDALESLERVPGEAPLQLDSAAARLERASVIVDALLGTGSAGAPTGAVASAIGMINQTERPVLSIDIPSGVDGSSGVVAGVAVRAAVTVTFHLAKPGLWINPGKRHAGRVEVIDIGIPRGAPLQASVGLIDRSVVEALPSRDASSTKFTSGHVLVAGGSTGLSGAPRMAGHAAMRAGAGYVTACVPLSLQPIVAGGPPELMVWGLPEDQGQLTEMAVQGAIDGLARGGALVLGPGLGRSAQAGVFARELARRSPVGTVIDADGLGAHAGRLSELGARAAATVLTPHDGELARLLECETDQVNAERALHVGRAAELSGAVVVLKGDDTLVAAPEGVLAVSMGDSPALATAGTGDVLAGVVGAFLAQGIEPFEAACAAVWVHAGAGRLAAQIRGAPEGVIATDVIEALPEARAGQDGR
jgi:ADP-dependent NAD(P)H-hydrate dehydratase / NAD(P)H-hydrate epimerase